MVDFVHIHTIKKKNCLPPHNYPHPSPYVERKQNFNFGEALAGVYPLLDIVFRYLPFTDLEVAKTVCKSWREIANKALENRGVSVKPKGIFVTNGTYVIRRSDKLLYNKLGYGIFCCSVKLWEEPYIIPSIKCYLNNEVEEMKISDYFQNNFFSHTPDSFVILRTSYVLHLPKLRGRQSVLGGFFFPQLPGIRIASVEGYRDLQPRKIIKENEKVVAFLLFSNKPLCKTKVQSILDEIREFCKENTAFGGGLLKVCSNASADGASSRVADVFGIEFLQHESSQTDFEAFSLIMKYFDDFYLSMSKFKDSIQLKANSLAICTLCCSIIPKNVINAFEELFPGVPLIGYDSNGEFGWNSKSGGSRSFGLTWKPEIVHVYTVSIVILTWDLRK